MERKRGPFCFGAKENIAWEVNAYALYMGRKGHTMAGQQVGRKDGRKAVTNMRKEKAVGRSE